MEKIDGNTIQKEIASSLQLAISNLKQGQPKLAIFAVDATEETERYIQKKIEFGKAIGCKITPFLNSGEGWCTESVIKELGYIQEACDGLVVQLPLPQGIDTQKVLESIIPAKDVDALREHSLFVSPVALAVRYILERADAWDTLAGKHVVIVGAGKTVGGPVIKLMESCGVVPTVLTKESEGEWFQQSLALADVVISGAGVPGLITGSMLKEGVVIIDAGFSFKDGKVFGDIDPSSYNKASYYSAVPGGVGPIAIALLFQNLVEAKKKNRY